MTTRRPLLVLLCASLAATPLVGVEFDVAAALHAASAGTVVAIPAGTYAINELEVPAGVQVHGAGYRATILVARTTANGLVVRGDGVTIRDLTIMNAGESGIMVQRATKVQIERVALRGCLTGILSTDATGLHLANLILATNRRGVVLTNNRATSLVNCTVVDNTVLGLSLSGGGPLAIFNNLFTGSPSGIWLDQDVSKVALDANVYATKVIGTKAGEPPRASLFGWRRLTGYDAHSVDLPVTFADAAAGEYAPVSRLAWNPTLATTSEWGLAELAGVTAPATDIDGKPRHGRIDIGAYEANFPTTRQPDGVLEIADNTPLTSAALYHPDGRMLIELMQNLPLPAGRHPWYVPARDQSNQAIPAGSYELRQVGSGLSNHYRGLAGNFARTSAPADNNSWPEEMIAFDRKDRVYVLQNSFENGQGVRAFDTAWSEPRWMMPGGSDTVGWATDEHWIYYLQGRGGGRFVLRKIDLETGAMGEIAPGVGSLDLAAPFTAHLRGLTLLDDHLFLSDPGTGVVYRGAASNPVFAPLATIPGALSITADEANGRLWIVAEGGELVALDPAKGTVLARSRPLPGIAAISARNGRLAALSTTTGTIQVLAARDPAALTLVRTIGTGDGPGGMQRPDRFWFQRNGSQPIGGSAGIVGKFSVAISGSGDVAVVDGPRTSLWAADGTLRKQGLGFWGQHLYAARWAPSEDIRLFGLGGDYAIAMDSRGGTWTPDGAWERPAYLYEDRAIRHVFAVGGKRFALLSVTLGDPQRTGLPHIALSGFDQVKQSFTGYLIARLDEQRLVPVLLTYNHPSKGTQVECHDLNHDGLIEADEGQTEPKRANGEPLSIPGARYGALPWTASGDVMFAGGQGADAACARIVTMTGLDPTGTWPMYDWAGSTPVKALGTDGGQPDLLSPYDFTTKERLTNTFQIAPFASGGYVQSAILKSSGGTGLANGAGTDLAGFSPDGRFRWLFKLAHREGSEGVQTLPTLGLALAMTSKECDYMVVDEDGLGLGALAMPAESHWMGMWSDHAQQQVAWIGNDGSANYVLGDYALNGYHWFRIDGTDQIRRGRSAVRITPATAATLAAAPALTPFVTLAPPTTSVCIPHLKTSLTIDGGLEKWRRAGVPVAAIITPETGTGIKSPSDCSAVLRFAWEGDSLYVQSIVFDNRATFHQPVNQMFQHDGIEMALNGFMEGFKYNISKTSDQGQVVLRNRFAQPACDRLYTVDQVPRSIAVHADSRAIEERHLIEALYGIDLAASPAIVTEFRLPLTAAVALAGDPTLIPTVGPGTQFHLGFMINDNDIPGGDVQKYLVWPATYATFGLKTQGALATLE